MGSWNGTCALTHLPISVDEEVYVLLLMEGKSYDKYRGNHCYSNTYYQPLPLYFEGKYNDYGAVEDCHGDFLEDIIECVRENLVEMELDDNKYHDIPVKKDKFDIDVLFEADHEARLYVTPNEYDRGRGVEKNRLTHITIRKGVLDKLLEEYVVEYSSPKHYMDSTMTFKTGVEKFYPKFRDEVKKYAPDGEGIIVDGKSISNLYMRSHRFYHNVPVSMVFDAHGIKQNVIDPYKLVSKYYTGAKFKSLYRNLATIGFLEIFMSRGRNQWIKPSGSGSQDDHVEAQLLLGKLIASGVEDIKQYRTDQGWDWGDED
jgi:hypothetical protein